MAHHILTLTDPARRDLRRARSLYRKHHPDRLPAFVAEIQVTLATIVEAPLRSPRVGNEARRRRVFQRFPFVLIFHIDGDRVIVDALRHTARGPDARFPEDP